jgi:hypothetical protein
MAGPARTACVGFRSIAGTGGWAGQSEMPGRMFGGGLASVLRPGMTDKSHAESISAQAEQRAGH